MNATLLTILVALAAPAPAPDPSAANAPTSGGGGALGWLNLLGLVALWGIGERQRRSR